MIDNPVRLFLLLLMVAVLVVAVIVLRRTRRPSRRGSIWAMIPTLIIWIVFEVWLLAGGSIVAAQWLSRLGVIGIATSFLYQLWSIDYSEHIEKRITDNGTT
jgi:hypothetical protein